MHHPLIEEFNKYKDEGIDKSIAHAEQGIEVVNDDYLSEIKKERLHLKDLIFQMLVNK